MNGLDVLQLMLFPVLLTAITPPLGQFMARVFQGEKTGLHKIFGGLEKLAYRLSGIDPFEEMGWKEYSIALIAFNLFGLAILMALQMLQGVLPLNPQALPAVPGYLAFNTAVSFISNTNWQSYAGETTMSYLTQMIGLAFQNFVSAAVGLAVAVALTRSIARRSAQGIGNFWVDLVRANVYILLPLSIVLALVLVWQGVVQNFSPYLEATTLEGLKQMIPMGPAASQIAIKFLGTNGGGFFNANSAHPFENPTAFSNLLQMLAMFCIPAALTYTFGVMTNARRHGWLIFGVMMSLFISLTALSLFSEYSKNPALGYAAVMEGKETRFGVSNSILFSTVTTSASCGAVNAMHSSLSPLSGGISMFNMMLGEIIFGGVGAGLYGMLLFILLTVFLAGLMVGRTPEYLGKKIEGREIMFVILAVLAPCAGILLGTAISAVLPAGLSSLANKGPHGFSEILYAFTSAAANNGSAFAGLNANTPYYNILLGVVILVGRFAIILPLLAIAGSLARKNISPSSSGTFEVDTPLFAILLVGVIMIVGALTFLPALSLGPIVEQILMMKGRTF